VTAETIIEVRDLVRHFVTRKPLFGAPTMVRAVDGVSLSIHRGETFAIVGESGCGKSTLARLLIRLLDPDAGSIVYRGRDLAELDEPEMRRLRRELQFIFQDPFSSLNPRMTVGALVEEPMRTHRVGSSSERRRRVAELLGRVGMRSEHASRYPHEFSGGQRQRIGIARALASGPQVIIADEPVSALDVSVQAQVVNLLEDLKEEFGLTLIIIAHDLAVIRHMSDRVAVMYLGKIAELAPTDGLYDQPLHPYTQALMAAIPVPEPGVRARAQPLAGDIPSPTAPPPGCRFHTRCPHAQAVCSEAEPPLEPAPGDRRVACHFWREIQDRAAGLPEAAPRAAAAEQRFALYRAYREKQEGARRRAPSDP
jgi:oligopeptide/dipeptide ABC transporter ATP-binding protein